jgi:hypothetical protein
MFVGKPNRKGTPAMMGIALVIVAAMAFWLVRAFLNHPTKVDPNPGQPPAFLTTIDLASAPQEVRDAAEKLRTSRVGYAMIVGEKTYLIISTGEKGPAVKIDRADAQPTGSKTPSFVDVFLKTAADGRQLQIATAPLKEMAEYQFNLDGAFAAIPALHNEHHLPLVYLDQATGFSVIAPVKDQMIEGKMLHLEGYARIFEAQFKVSVITAKGREVGTTGVHAAVGAPNWGSFVADLQIDTTNLPETGFVVFEDDMSGAKVAVPVRFHRPAELG